MSKPTPPGAFILIPRRTSRQDTTLSAGKFSAGYVAPPSDETVRRAIGKRVRELQAAGNGAPS
jgi:hypothetical protein